MRQKYSQNGERAIRLPWNKHTKIYIEHLKAGNEIALE